MSLEGLMYRMEEVMDNNDVFSKELEEEGLYLFAVDGDRLIASFVSDNFGCVEIRRPREPKLLYSIGTTTTIILKISNRDISLLYIVIGKALKYQQLIRTGYPVEK